MGRTSKDSWQQEWLLFSSWLTIFHLEYSGVDWSCLYHLAPMFVFFFSCVVPFCHVFACVFWTCLNCCALLVFIYLFISCNGSLFAAICLVIIYLRFGPCFFQNHVFMSICFNVIDKHRPFFPIRKLPWMELPLFTSRQFCHGFDETESKDLGCWNFQDVHAMEEDGARLSSQSGSWQKNSVAPCDGTCESVRSGVPEISRKSSLYMSYIRICIRANKQACQLVFRISQVGGMLWLHHFGIVAA